MPWFFWFLSIALLGAAVFLYYRQMKKRELIEASVVDDIIAKTLLLMTSPENKELEKEVIQSCRALRSSLDIEGVKLIRSKLLSAVLGFAMLHCKVDKQFPLSDNFFIEVCKLLKIPYPMLIFSEETCVKDAENFFAGKIPANERDTLFRHRNDPWKGRQQARQNSAASESASPQSGKAALLGNFPQEAAEKLAKRICLDCGNLLKDEDLGHRGLHKDCFTRLAKRIELGELSEDAAISAGFMSPHTLKPESSSSVTSAWPQWLLPTFLLSKKAVSFGVSEYPAISFFMSVATFIAKLSWYVSIIFILCNFGWLSFVSIAVISQQNPAGLLLIPIAVLLSFLLLLAANLGLAFSFAMVEGVVVVLRIEENTRVLKKTQI